MRVLEIYGDSADFGRTHAAEYAPLIKAYLADRLDLAGDALWSGQNADADTILSLAESTLGHHEAYSESLFEEMGELAATSGISAAEAVVVGGFTDLIDLVRASGPAPVMDECTAVIDPIRGVLAQTWDMHVSAGEYVVLLKLDPLSGPAALVQTTAGCLGQIGMNEAGIAIGINNLTSIGKPGVTWPFVVRKVLQQTDFDDAVKCVLDADLAGGHNFLLMGPDGVGANIEAMPGARHVTPVEVQPFVHTNHCIEATTKSEEGWRDDVYVINSDLRLAKGSEHGGDLEAFFGDPVISKHATDPHLSATCGAMVMRPSSRSLETIWGVPGDRPWESFQL